MPIAWKGTLDYGAEAVPMLKGMSEKRVRDAAGKGIQREFLWFTQSIQPLARMIRDARGAFSLRLPENVASARPDILRASRHTFATDSLRLITGSRAARSQGEITSR
jgi:hypothetical protein